MKLPPILIGILVCGCADATPRAVAPATRDSAGITLVTTHGVTAEPYTVARVLSIGAVDEGATEYELHRVRHMARLSDGTIVASNRSQELRWFGPDGRWVRTVGRKGGGPGEFEAVDYLRRLDGDSVLVHDRLNRRVTIIAPDGRVARDFTPPAGADGNPLQVAAALADGSLLLRATVPIPEVMEQTRRDTVIFSIIADSQRVLRAYAGDERHITVSRSATTFSTSIASLPFSRDLFATASADAFVIGSNETYEIHSWSRGGRLLRILRRSDVTPRVVDDALMEAYNDTVIAEIVRRGPERPGAPAPDPASIRRSFTDLPRAPSTPVYQDVVAGDDGSLWVQQFSLGSEAPKLWDVYAADGSMQHTVQLPARFRPLLLHADSVYGVERDDLDVEHIVIYRVRGTS